MLAAESEAARLVEESEAARRHAEADSKEAKENAAVARRGHHEAESAMEAEREATAARIREAEAAKHAADEGVHAAAARAAARGPRLLEAALSAMQGGAVGLALGRWRQQAAALVAYDALRPELVKAKRASSSMKKALKETEASIV